MLCSSISRLFIYFGFVMFQLFSGEEIWEFFFDKKLINTTKSGCEGQLSEIIFSIYEKILQFFIEY
jgi:hypothetical protein